MAVSVDKVYQKVLALTNKEQRGYITPQEFNLFADHAQLDIFEQYFYDLEQRQRGIGNELDYGDIVSTLEEKISMFERLDSFVGVQGTGEVLVSSNVGNLHKLGAVKVKYGTNINFKVADKIQANELSKYENSALGVPTELSPVYTKFSSTNGSIKIKVFPAPINVGDSVTVDYIVKPSSPNWTYLISGNNALYNPNGIGHRDFELHASEENNLVIKILQLAGVAIKDFNLAQIAAQEEAVTTQQQKQ
jgi:hypothetical protein